MSNSNNPFGGKPAVKADNTFSYERQYDAAGKFYEKDLGSERNVTTAGDGTGAMTDRFYSAGVYQLRETAGNERLSQTKSSDLLAGTLQTHTGSVEGMGGGAQGAAIGYVAHAGSSLTYGTPQANVTGTADVRGLFGQLRGQALAGDDGRYQGVALGGIAEVAAVDGLAIGQGAVSMDWVPFVPKGWTLGVKGVVEGELGVIGGAGGAYMMRDRADNRVHIGGFGGLGALLGLTLFGEINFGPAALTPQQQAVAAAEAAKAAEAEKKRAAADLIRPMARVTDPLGAHSSNKGWLGMAIGLAVAALVIVAFPIVIGVGVFTGLVGAALIGLGAIGMLATGASVGAQLGKLKKTEDGSECSKIQTGSSKTKCEGLWVARIDDPNTHGNGKLKTGAKMVVEGPQEKNVSRVKEASTCGAAKVLRGAQKTFIGGISVTSGAKDEPTAGDGKLDEWIKWLDRISLVTGLLQLPLMGVQAALKGGSLALAKVAASAAERATFRETMALAAQKGIPLAARRELAAQAVLNATARGAEAVGGAAAGKGAAWALGASTQVVKEAAIPAAFMAGSHYGEPAMEKGLVGMGMSPEQSKAFAQGMFFAGPVTVAGGMARLGGVKGSWSGGLAEASESLNAFKSGNRMEGLFGKGSTSAGAAAAASEDVAAGTARVPTDDVAGGASGGPREAPANAESNSGPRLLESPPEPRPVVAAAEPVKVTTGDESFRSAWDASPTDNQRRFLTDNEFANQAIDNYHATGELPPGLQSRKAYRVDTRPDVTEFAPNPDRSWQTGSDFVHTSASEWGVDKYFPYTRRYSADPSVHVPGERGVVGDINLYELDVVGIHMSEMDALGLPDFHSTNYPKFEDVILTPKVPASGIKKVTPMEITGEVVDVGTLPDDHPFWDANSHTQFPGGADGWGSSNTPLRFHDLQFEPATGMKKPTNGAFIIDRPEVPVVKAPTEAAVPAGEKPVVGAAAGGGEAAASGGGEAGGSTAAATEPVATHPCNTCAGAKPPADALPANPVKAVDAGASSGAASAWAPAKPVATARDFFDGASFTSKVEKGWSSSSKNFKASDAALSREPGKFRESLLGRDSHAIPYKEVAAMGEAGHLDESAVIDHPPQGDGVDRTRLRLPTEYAEKRDPTNSKQGYFEFVRDPDGTINHAAFKEDPAFYAEHAIPDAPALPAPVDPITSATMDKYGITPDTKLYRVMNPKYLDAENMQVAGNASALAHVEDPYNLVPNPVQAMVIAERGAPMDGMAMEVPARVRAKELGPGLNVALQDPEGYAEPHMQKISVRAGDVLDAGGKFYPDISSQLSGIKPLYVTLPKAIPFTFE